MQAITLVRGIAQEVGAEDCLPRTIPGELFNVSYASGNGLVTLPSELIASVKSTQFPYREVLMLRSAFPPFFRLVAARGLILFLFSIFFRLKRSCKCTKWAG